jgi:hypothetical protein
MKNLLKASFLKNTTEIEKDWIVAKHIGFNHIKFEKEINKHFRIIKKVNIFFQMIYLITLDGK